MMTWDDLTEEQKKRLAEKTRTFPHGSVNRSIILDRLDTREQAFLEAIAWLAANGFADASAALDNVAFERPVTS